jgi:hypothetical protein
MIAIGRSVYSRLEALLARTIAWGARRYERGSLPESLA